MQNAVVDALRPLGVRHLDLPCTPQRVWAGVRDARAGVLADPWREPPAVFADLPVRAARRRRPRAARSKRSPFVDRSAGSLARAERRRTAPDGEEAIRVSSSIDKVLQDAVDAGAVPRVAAIAADRNGIIYEGAAGPRVAGASEPSPSTPTSGSCR